MSRSLAKPGFTLVELLVVISLIVLLVALLIPSLGKARDAMRRMTCASNQHQVGGAFVDYASNNVSRFPLNAANNTGYGPALFELGGNTQTSMVHQLRPYVGNFECFRCPTNPDAPPPDDPANNSAVHSWQVWAFWYLANYRNAGGVYVSKVNTLHDNPAGAVYSDIIHSYGPWIGNYGANHTKGTHSNPAQPFAANPSARWNVVDSTSQIAGANVLHVDASVTFTAFEDLELVNYGSVQHWYGRQP